MDIYKMSFKELAGHLAKRALLLAAKLMGFKAFCLFLTTILLLHGFVDKDAWLTVIITVLCSASGVHIADRFGTIQGGLHDYRKKNRGAASGSSNLVHGKCSSMVTDRVTGVSDKAKEEARNKIGELCRRAAAQLERAGGRI
ncbi:MAG: hypothetical protein IJ828_02820 [Treponema sp.]|nr:hypothetical protein [Treponema sp.]